MLVRLGNIIISKIKHSKYVIDSNITDTVLMGIILEKSIMCLRGFINKLFFKKSHGILFIGKNVKLKCKRNIAFKGTTLIEDGVKIDALSKGGIEIGENFSIGRNSIIECTGVLRELGEKLTIGKNVGIAANAFISMRGPVTIGNDCIFGPNVKIHAENHIFDKIDIPIRMQGATRKGIEIGDDCWIGSNVTILDGVKIGKGCVIAAGAVINKDIPDYSIAGGVPAKIIKKKWSEVILKDKKLNGTVIVTYRCNARCTMCNRYKCPSKPDEEISIETIKKLPKMYFTNITGGEPFIREDLQDVVEELYKKSDRIVISTNGFFTDRIIAMAKRFPNIGIRISIEGLEQTNNEIRGLQDGYRRGYETLKKLKEMGMKDVGFGMTVQDKNAPDLVPLYNISNEMNMEFATASLHNSFYFVEAKNIIHDRPMVAQNFENLINELLNSNSPKKWFRAYFNHGLINYIYGQKRLLPCDMAFDTFFIDPYGDVMPCNGTKDKEVMGNLNECATWEELWNGEQAENVRTKVRHCDRQCWMIGSVSPAMKKYIWSPAWWVFRHKVLRFFKTKKYSMYENKIVRDLRDGKVTKEQLDKCSTCDMNCIVNNGLSKASLEQLKNKTGEEIVDADIEMQLNK